MSWILKIAKSLTMLYFVLYIIVHVIIFLSTESVRYLVFQNNIHWPFHNLTHPSEHNLKNVHNFYLNVEPGVRVGVWHYIPESYQYDPNKHSDLSIDKHLKKYISNKKENKVIIYAHGNDRNRAAPFRVKHCKNLVDLLKYHVFAIDYRGYGDSTGTPSEEGAVKDLLYLYNMIMSHNKNTTIYLYGHSLGTAIVTHAARKISEFNLKIDGVVLEAPFLNVSQASKDYHASLLFMNNRWIIEKVDDSLNKLNINFNTDKNILKVNSKILILHAEDDWFIPIQHSYTLNEMCKNKEPPVKLIELKKDLNLGHFPSAHIPIYKIIKNFLEDLTD